MKHTQGEWKTRTVDDEDFGYEIGLSSRDVDAIACVFRLHKTLVEAEANAKLIAAAPELLEACLQMSANVDKWLESGESATPEKSEQLHNLMKTAIKKAIE